MPVNAGVATSVAYKVLRQSKVSSQKSCLGGSSVSWWCFLCWWAVCCINWACTMTTRAEHISLEAGYLRRPPFCDPERKRASGKTFS